MLKNADFKLAENNEIYRTGVIGQFNLTFELAGKALQEVLKLHVQLVQNGILQKSYSWDTDLGL